jgi:steroid delta-isomerase-like uncharacterized protein
MTSAENTPYVVRCHIDEILNNGRLDLLDELWAPDLVWQGGSLGDIHGIADYRRMLAARATDAFPDLRLNVHDMIAAGAKVVVRYSNSGTQTGAFLGIPAGGKHARWPGIGIYTVTGGKISEAWIVEDILDMLLQLDAISFYGNGVG